MSGYERDSSEEEVEEIEYTLRETSVGSTSGGSSNTIYSPSNNRKNYVNPALLSPSSQSRTPQRQSNNVNYQNITPNTTTPIQSQFPSTPTVSTTSSNTLTSPIVTRKSPYRPNSTPLRYKPSHNTNNVNQKAPLIKFILFSTILVFVSFIIAVFIYESSRTSSKPGQHQNVKFCNTEDRTHDSDCVPCPNYGYCAHHKLVSCPSSYIIMDNSCIKDEEIVKSANKMKNEVTSLLQRKYGQFLCYSPIPLASLNTTSPSSYGLSDSSLQSLLETDYSWDFSNDKIKQTFYEMKKLLMESKHFEKDLEGSEIVYSVKPEYAVMPLTCKIKRDVVSNLYLILPGIVVLVGVMVLFKKMKRSNIEEKMVEEIVEEVKELLMMQKERARKEEKEGKELSSLRSWVLMNHIRGSLWNDVKERRSLGEEFGGRVWKKVRDRVKGDTRIVEGQRQVEGRPEIVWEWTAEFFPKKSKQM